MPAYDFLETKKGVKTPSGRQDKVVTQLDLRGIDLTTPVDLIKDGHTPFAKNFRLYAQQVDDRRVAVSSRKGPGFYINPLGEALVINNNSTTGADIANVGVIEQVHIQPFVATNSDRLTRIDISVANPDAASGPLLVQIYSDNEGPASLLAESAILSGDIGATASYEIARFIEAVQLEEDATYWIVIRIQDDGNGFYELSTTTAGTYAWSTDSALQQAVEQTYSINFRLYTSVDGADKGAYRFARDNGENTTLVAYNDTMYTIDESTNSLVELYTDLDPAAEEYRFANGDNKVFWVNSYDKLMYWDGTVPTGTNIVSNPSFTTNTTGWVASTSAAIARDTTTFNTTPASLKVTRASGFRGAEYAFSAPKGRIYTVTFWARSESGTATVKASSNEAGDAGWSVNTTWQQITYTMVPATALTKFVISSEASNFYIDDVSIVDMGVNFIEDTELPILSDLIMHKDRLFGIAANDLNRMVWCEAPGNPAYDPTGLIPTNADEQWYHAWLSTSYWYVPRPHNGSPVTGFVSFQDSLIIFTQDQKYVFSGSDKGSFHLRESTGAAGALSKSGIIADENNIYFVGVDGFYQFNGSADKKISKLINPLFDGCSRKDKITVAIWKNEVRFYLSSSGVSYNDSCIIYNKDLEEMQYDTETWVNRAIPYEDADDDQSLIEFSSLVQTAYRAEQNYHGLGAPIDFEYRFSYDSMGNPAMKKRMRKYFPLLQGVDKTFDLQIAMDKDFEDSPRIKDVLLTTNGAKIGEFVIGDGTLLGGDKSFKQHRQSFSGYAYYWQLRIMRKAVDNRVAFIGAQYSYKSKRL